MNKPIYQVKDTTTLKDVEKFANQILHEANIIEPPIDPRKLADDWGIKVYFVPFSEDLQRIDGFYCKSDNTIVVNANTPINRQTFTIAHELGHCCLHDEYLTKNNIDIIERPKEHNDKPIEEKQADVFATNLLLPKNVFEKYRKICNDNITELADIFLVSKDFIKNRIEYLDKYKTITQTI